MAHGASIARRALLAAAVFLAAAALGYAQSAQGSPSSAGPGHPSEPGVLVISVQPGSPADTAGITRGDIILQVNGTAVNTAREIRRAIAGRSKGDTVTLTVLHGDAQKTPSVTLAARDGRPYLGVALLPDRPQWLGERWERGWMERGTRGAVVERVAAGGPADKAGLKRGDVILSVDGTPVDGEHSLGALIREKKAGDTVTLSVTERGAASGANPRAVSVTLGASPDGKRPWLGVTYLSGSWLTHFIPPADWEGPAGSL